MIETLAFGGTGHASTRAIFGAAALGAVIQDEADATFDLLARYGVNHFDTAASYGESELRIGSWIARHGRPSFLATKTGERKAGAAREQLQQSLDRLRVDSVDLWQLHNLVDALEWETALGPDGALEAAIAARAEGLVRFIGITGHGLTVARQHRRALERFPFDAVLLPYSYVLMQNPVYAADFEALATVCREQQVAMQTIKSIVQAPWGDASPSRATWYRPLEEQADIDLAVHWVLGRPDVFLNTVGDIHVLPKVLDAAGRFVERPADDMLHALARTRAMAPLFV